MKTRPWIVTAVVILATLMVGCSFLTTADRRPGDGVQYSAVGVQFTMRSVPGATFPTGPDDRGEATVIHDFWIGETEVTYELWYAVRAWAEENGYAFANPGREGNSGLTGGEPTRNKDHPVTMIRWYDVLVWCNALSEYLEYEPVYAHEGRLYRDSRESPDEITIRKVAGFRLLTCEEWELAARYRGQDGSGDAIEYPEGSGMFWTPGSYASGAEGPYTDEEATTAVAWYRANTDRDTQPVGQKPSRGNHLNLYDMSGNVYEWVDASERGAPGLRGGCVYRDAVELQIGVANPRGAPPPDQPFTNVGFRLALSEEVDPTEVALVDHEPEDAEEDDEQEDPTLDQDDAGVAFPVKSLVEVQWRGNWYGAQVLEVDGDKYLISYDGYESDWDEWVDISRIRDRADGLLMAAVERSEIVVDHGTQLADVEFPGEVQVSLQDGSTFWADVRWGPAPYDSHAEGEYPFSGELMGLPPNVTNPHDVQPILTVRVRDPEGSTSRIRIDGDTDVDGLLWYIEHDDGARGYFFGTSSRIDLTHRWVFDDRGRFHALIVYDQGLLPIQWIFEDLTISIVVPRDSEFDPREAAHVFAFERELVDFALDIEMNMTVEQVLDRLPQVFGSSFSGPVESLRGILAEHTDALPWTVERMGEAAESPYEVSIASTITAACVVIRIIDGLDAIAEGRATGDAGRGESIARGTEEDWADAVIASIDADTAREIRQRLAKEISKMTDHKAMGPLLQMLMYLERIASRDYDGLDIEGPAVSMLLCKGQSPIPNHCTEFYMPNVGGNASRCVRMCYVTLNCFTDICHPMMFSVDDAKNLRVR